MSSNVSKNRTDMSTHTERKILTEELRRTRCLAEPAPEQQQKVNARTQADAFVDARPSSYFLICKHFVSLKSCHLLGELGYLISEVLINIDVNVDISGKILSKPECFKE